tara:strand:+ start:464 stop:1417 length:954 start_codon:yes stop_codon:yes gene_type:complete
MDNDDYGAISVISDDEREALGLGGPRPDEEEGIFETLGKAGDKIGETKIGQKIGSILTVLILAMFGSGTADLGMLTDLWGEEEVGPVGGCMDPGAINYNSKSTFDNGSCTFPPPVIYGCTNSAAENYNEAATHDNGRCQFLGGPVGNSTTNNQTQTNETIIGCMDLEALNYNDKAEEDDGSCEYGEEYNCTTNQTYFYQGMQYGNHSREDNTLNITVDIDTNCDQDTLPVMVEFDVGHIKVVDNETVWNGYVFNNYYYNVTGWEVNNYVLQSHSDYFTEPYTGFYVVYVNLYADYNHNGTYEWVNYFNIIGISLEEI